MGINPVQIPEHVDLRVGDAALEFADVVFLQRLRVRREVCHSIVAAAVAFISPFGLAGKHGIQEVTVRHLLCLCFLKKLCEALPGVMKAECVHHAG